MFTSNEGRVKLLLLNSSKVRIFFLHNLELELGKIMISSPLFKFGECKKGRTMLVFISFYCFMTVFFTKLLVAPWTDNWYINYCIATLFADLVDTRNRYSTFSKERQTLINNFAYFLTILFWLF